MSTKVPKYSKLNKQFLKRFFLLGLFISPFIYWPTAIVPFEIPRVLFIRYWIIALGIVSLVCLPKLQKRGLDLVIFFSIFFFLAFLSISSYLGVDFDKSFWGNYFRRDGLLTLSHLASLSIILSLYWNKSWFPTLIKALGISTLLISLWAVFQSRLTIPVAVSFGQPNFLAGYLLVTFPFTIHLLKKNRNKKLWISAIILQSIAILLTQSKIGILGLPLIFIAYKSLGLGKISKFSFFLFFTTVVILAGLVAFKEPREINPNNYVAESRGRIVRKGFIAFSKRPFLGWGWANFDYAFDSVDWPMKFNTDVYVDKAHSHFLEILVTSGVPGLSSYLLIVFLVTKKLIRSKSDYAKTLLFSLLIFIVHTQTNVISIAEELLFWVITGVATSNSI